MKRFLILLLSLCLLAGCACAESLPQPEPATLCAVGSAEVPDLSTRAILTFEMSAFGETVSAAQEQMDGMLSTLREALKAQGIVDQAIRSTHYDVHGQYEYHYTKLTETDLLTGYNVIIDLEAYVEDAHNVGKIIDAVHDTGVDCSYDLVYETVDDPAAYDAALALAAQDAMRKAGLLAEACGLTLDRLLSIEETGGADLAMVKATYTVK